MALAAYLSFSFNYGALNFCYSSPQQLHNNVLIIEIISGLAIPCEEIKTLLDIEK